MTRLGVILSLVIAGCGAAPRSDDSSDIARDAGPFTVERAPQALPEHRYAVVVGVNRYPEPKLNDLRAAVADAKLFGRTLHTRFGFQPRNVRVLTDAQATHAGLLQALAWLESKAGPDRSVVFFFAGHGSRTRDQSGDEPDGYDETLVPYDAHRDPSRAPLDLVDDQLGAMVRRIASKGGGVTIVLDACHSGTGTKGDDVVRTAVPFEVPADQGLAEGTDWQGGLGYVALAGAAADEQAVERPLRHPDGRIGPYHGLFTQHLVAALEAAGPGETWAQVMQRVRGAIRATKAKQTPQLEGSAGAQRPFALVEPLPPASVSADRTGAERPDGRAILRLPVGKAQGFGVGSEFMLFPLGADLRRVEQAVGRLRLKRVEPHGSEGALVEGGSAPAHGRAVVHRRVPVTPPLRIWRGGEALPSPWVQGGTVKPADGPETADVVVTPDRGGFRVQGPVGPPTTVSPDGLAQRIEDWATWKIARSLVASVPPDLPVAFKAVRAEGGAGPYRPGDRVTLTVASDAGRRLYLTLLALGDDGHVHVLHPPQAGSQPFLKPFGTFQFPVRMGVPEGRQRSMTWIRLVATTEPTPMHFLATSGRGDWRLPPGRMLIMDLELLTERAGASAEP